MKRALAAIMLLFFCANCSMPDATLKCSSSAKKIDSIGELKIDLNVFFNDVEQAKKCVEITAKPILTIYGCYACVGDNKVMWEILSVSEIHRIVAEKFIVSYLYVDDKTSVNDSISQTVDYNGIRIQNIGQLNSNRQVSRYNTFYQPMYSITNYKDIDLAEPIGYTPLAKWKNFEKFLAKGLNKQVLTGK